MLCWILVAAALLILVGGLVYDGTRDGEAPNLSWLYIIAVAVGLLAVLLGYRVRRGPDR